MNKTVLLVFVLCILSFTSVKAAFSSGKVDVVVAGDISHGPMQPTIRAIKDVTSKYGQQITVTWVDLDTAEGKKYFDEHGLSAHLNILINGKYQYLLDGRKVTFQWFEGTQWSKNDLDAVLSGLLNNSGNVTLLENSQGGDGVFGLIFALLRPPIILVAVIVVGALYLVRRSRKRKAMKKRAKPSSKGKR